MLYYKGLIEMRKHYNIFTNTDTQIVNVQELPSGVVAVTLDDGKGGQALVVINPHSTVLPFALEGQWNLVADVSHAGAAVLGQHSGEINVEGISIRVYVNDALAQQ
jgi:hypothetical protein